MGGGNLTTSITLKKNFLPHILSCHRNDNTFENHLKSHNPENNKISHKKQIPKLLMSFYDDKIDRSVLGHGKCDSSLSRITTYSLCN
jgi:hypothetical protein